MLEIFEVPYGADLCWLYEEEVYVGFYGLVKDGGLRSKKLLIKYRLYLVYAIIVYRKSREWWKKYGL